MPAQTSSSNAPRARQQQILHRLVLTLFFMLLGGVLPLAQAAPPAHYAKGIFLVATENLNGSSFQETVILLTHNSRRGATGLAINRPTDIPLQQAFPRIRQFQKNTDPLYLGGPVSTNAIFVLTRTRQPRKSMHHIADDIYFSTGKNAFAYPLEDATRTYAGYTGWSAGQLQNEINRGDWLIVHARPEIIFEKNPANLWQRLIKRWSGQWI